jgi:hypothetical protein
MTITISAFERSPDGGKELARDTRVRWALEEVGHPYEVRLVSFRAMKEPVHLALHPFGQIPTYEEGVPVHGGCDHMPILGIDHWSTGHGSMREISSRNQAVSLRVPYPCPHAPGDNPTR